MEYLTLKRKQFIKENDFIFDCFDILSENVDINYFYNYLNSLIEYKLKNIWNLVISKWEYIHINYLKLKSINPEYYQQSYKYIHEIITYKDLNKVFTILLSIEFSMQFLGWKTKAIFSEFSECL